MTSIDFFKEMEFKDLWPNFVKVDDDVYRLGYNYFNGYMLGLNVLHEMRNILFTPLYIHEPSILVCKPYSLYTVFCNLTEESNGFQHYPSADMPFHLVNPPPNGLELINTRDVYNHNTKEIECANCNIGYPVRIVISLHG